jgi:Na+/H+ antiporter NhaC
MPLTWLSLVPPLIVIGSVYFTHQLNISLVVGILSAALIATQGGVIPALLLSEQKFVTHFSDWDNIYMYLLLVVMSSLIILLTVTGAAAGCAQIIGKKMRTKRSVECSTIMLSFLLSIDDYLSILTVGFVMKPIADRVAVARTKIAYIVHALAGPLVIIMPISTWAAAILVQLDNAGIHLNAPHKIIADPLSVYLKTIPFIFYSLLVVGSVCCVVIFRVAYGLIARDEHNAIAVDEHTDNLNHNHSLLELLMPLMIFIGGIFIGVLYAGNHHHTFLIFLLSGLSALIVSICFALYKHMISLVQIPALIYEGAVVMRSSIMMVAFASILGSFLRIELQTGSYVAYLLLGTLSLWLVPVMLFIVSLIITLTTGSAWGTFSLLIPIMTQMLIALLQLETPVTLDQIPLLFPALGAVLSGAACGNHVSPIAETTIMTATSTGIEPLQHAKSQFYYVAPVMVGTLASFFVVGLLYNSGFYKSFVVSFGVGAAVSGLMFIAANYWKK